MMLQFRERNNRKKRKSQNTILLEYMSFNSKKKGTMCP